MPKNLKNFSIEKAQNDGLHNPRIQRLVVALIVRLHLGLSEAPIRRTGSGRNKPELWGIRAHSGGPGWIGVSGSSGGPGLDGSIRVDRELSGGDSLVGPK